MTNNPSLYLYNIHFKKIKNKKNHNKKLRVNLLEQRNKTTNIPSKRGWKTKFFLTVFSTLASLGLKRMLKKSQKVSKNKKSWPKFNISCPLQEEI